MENLPPSAFLHIHKSLLSTFKLALSSMIINFTSDSSSESLKLLFHYGFQFRRPSSQNPIWSTVTSWSKETMNNLRNNLIKWASTDHLSLQNKVDSPFSTFLHTCSNQPFTLSTYVMLSTSCHHVKINVELKIVLISLIGPYLAISILTHNAFSFFKQSSLPFRNGCLIK